MANKALRVYVSSTFVDLKEYRQVVRESILRLGALPVVMELFGASSGPPLEVCKEEVQRSDVMVLIVGHRYGAVLPGEDVSLTEVEFNAAREADIPTLAFIVDDNYPWPLQWTDHGEAAARLKRFKERLRSDLIVGYFTSPSDLEVRVVQALYEFLSKQASESTEAPQLKRLKPPGDSDKGHNELVIKIEEHLNYLRTSVAEMRDQMEQSHSNPDATVVSSNRHAAFLGPPAAALEKDLCFVAMPYSKDWSKALEGILLDICKSSGMRLLIARNMDGRFIPHDIWQGITAAAVIVADITDGNPNVAYEIGLADVLGKEVVLLCQGDTVPFDFLGQRLICYENTMRGSIILREELTARLRQIREKSDDM
ncbi:MAG: DUF4062 domain-containing protein [Pyrinomonadaceae bacterium]